MSHLPSYKVHILFDGGGRAYVALTDSETAAFAGISPLRWPAPPVLIRTDPEPDRTKSGTPGSGLDSVESRGAQE